MLHEHLAAMSGWSQLGLMCIIALAVVQLNRMRKGTLDDFGCWLMGAAITALLISLAGCKLYVGAERRCLDELHGTPAYRNCHSAETREPVDESGNTLVINHTQCEVVCTVHDSPAEKETR